LLREKHQQYRRHPYSTHAQLGRRGDDLAIEEGVFGAAVAGVVADDLGQQLFGVVCDLRTLTGGLQLHQGV